MERTVPRIYVVDDETVLAQMTSSLLGVQGLKPLVFNNPVKALDHIRNNPTDTALLITDCIMGPMNGLELIEEFQKVVANLRTILLSGTITNEFIKACQVQPDRFIPKPYASDTLLRAIDELMGMPTKQVPA
jgi:DNA-binding NtrC family response regulator